MTITLTDDLENLINDKVRSGAYKSADEVIMASLRLLEAREKGMDELRQEVMRGVEDIKQGRLAVYETDAQLEAFADDVIRQGQERRNTYREQ